MDRYFESFAFPPYSGFIMCDVVRWDFKYIYSTAMLSYSVCYLNIMANPMLDEILFRLQNAEIIEDEEDIFFLTPEDVAASFVENKRSCVGKIIADQDVNVQGLWRCL